MLQSELIEAWQAAAKLHNAKEVETAKQRGVTTICYGLVPETLTPWEQSFLSALYQRPELDDLLGVPTRHDRFAAFAVRNYPNWSRVTERLLYQLCVQAEGAGHDVTLVRNGETVEVRP